MYFYSVKHDWNFKDQFIELDWILLIEHACSNYDQKVPFADLFGSRLSQNRKEKELETIRLEICDQP